MAMADISFTGTSQLLQRKKNVSLYRLNSSFLPQKPATFSFNVNTEKCFPSMKVVCSVAPSQTQAPTPAPTTTLTPDGKRTDCFGIFCLTYDLKEAVFEEEEYVHLVMELCAGGELFDQLQKQGRYSEPDAARLFKHLMEVVKYCHDNGVVHRDLKPENILLATKSPSSPIKLADFGLATYFTPGQKLNGTVGSPFYIAPEVLSGGYNEAADVWSAGVILYILLSGIPPFWGKTKSKIFDAVREAKLQFPKDNWGSISSSAKDLISRMLCTDPKKRLTSVEVLEHPWITGQVELSRHSSNGVKGKQGITCNSLSSGEPKTMASFSSAFDYNNKTDILSSFKFLWIYSDR